MRVILNIFLFLFGIGFLILFVGIGLFMAGFGGVDKDYSVTELKENFEEKRAEIYKSKII